MLSEPGNPTKRYLVYTSAGDHTNLRRWLKGKRNFDLWITYYGDGSDSLRAFADLYNRREGSKFQNLLHIYQTWPSLVQTYEAILVMDDDILISGSEIERLFEIRQRHDLWVLQPAFHPRGKISHDITAVRPGFYLRYTNFVEMTCPLFRRDQLDVFMKVYDPILTGFGMDWWFLDVMGEDLRGRVAIVDEITCVNPLDVTKGGRREIDQLQPAAKRAAIWEEVKRAYGIRAEERGISLFEAIPSSTPRRQLSKLRHRLDPSVALTQAWLKVLEKADRVRARLHKLSANGE